jgi:hypothetical protein
MEENRFISNFKKNNPNEECPQNLGLKWSIHEEEELLQYLNENKTLEEIARIHKRTVGGIDSRIKTIVCKFLKNGMDLELISNKTNLDKSEILQIKTDNELKLMNKRKEKEKEIRMLNDEINFIRNNEQNNDDIMKMLIKIYNKIDKNKKDELDDIKSEIMMINQNIKNIYKQLKRLDLA